MILLFIGDSFPFLLTSHVCYWITFTNGQIDIHSFIPSFIHLGMSCSLYSPALDDEYPVSFGNTLLLKSLRAVRFDKFTKVVFIWLKIVKNTNIDTNNTNNNFKITVS